MPNYYNPNLFYPATYVSPYGGSMAPQMQLPMMNNSGAVQQYMISVDGEGSARAWQPMQPMGPNTIVPLWDLDGQHLYFKSTDAYGRMNPIRKARVVFEDEPQLPQGQSGAANQQAPQMPDMSQFVTKADLDEMKNELIRSMGQKNQNGRNFEQNRGENK